MKVLLRCAALFCLAVALSGCGGVDNSTSTPDNIPEQPSEGPSADAPPPMAAP